MYGDFQATMRDSEDTGARSERVTDAYQAEFAIRQLLDC